MNVLARAYLTARVVARLGIKNVGFAVYHRISERFYVPQEIGKLPPGPLFTWAADRPPPPVEGETTLERARRISLGELEIFGGRWVQLGSPYRWHDNVLGTAGGDIKGIWEASRCGWAIDLARAHRLDPAQGFGECLERYMQDWLEKHSSLADPNWRCGQEASIRMLHLLLAQHILSATTKLTPLMVAVVRLHATRIERTIRYAIAQDNNHATSEAAALFIAGSLLLAQQKTLSGGEAERWQRTGRVQLEKLLRRLVLDDGGFAQYSVNYHRLLLDTLSQVEFWRRRTDAAEFSAEFKARCEAAIRWLGGVSNETTGRAPNLGYNDGAQICSLTSRGFGDQRPSLALASALWLGTRLRDAGDDEPMLWLGMSPPTNRDPTILAKKPRLFDDWGLILMNGHPDGSRAYGFLRYPVRRRFRPAQADPLHFDLWTAQGQNLLLDAGTFSYADPDGLRLFASVRSHNTVQFDDDEPMRRIGQFLYADWPNGTGRLESPEQDGTAFASAAYTDYRGCRHVRSVAADGNRWTVTDEVRGHRRKATVRWHLPMQEHRLNGSVFDSAGMRITLSGVDGDTIRIEEGSISPTYGVREPALVLVADAGPGPQVMQTVIELGSS